MSVVLRRVRGIAGIAAKKTRPRFCGRVAGGY